MTIDLASAAEVATIAGVPLLIVGWFVGSRSKTNRATGARRGNAAAGDVQGAHRGIAVGGLNNNVSFILNTQGQSIQDVIASAQPALDEDFRAIATTQRDILEELKALNEKMKAAGSDAISLDDFMSAFSAELRARGNRSTVQSINPSGTGAPATELRFVEFPNRSFWHIGQRGKAPQNQPIMQIVADWYVTNVSSVPVQLLSARLLEPEVNDPQGFSIIGGGEDLHATHTFKAAIPPGETWHVTVQFYVGPPTHVEGASLPVAFVLVDQFGHEHLPPHLTLRWR